jgi:two-component system invasion response regulator UvrY
VKIRRILVATNQTILLEGMCHLLAEARLPRTVHAAQSISALLRLVHSCSHDVIVLTEPVFNLPITLVARQIKELRDDVRIVALMDRASPLCPTALFEYGAYAVLSTDCSVEELHRAVASVECGNLYISDYVTDRFAAILTGMEPPHLKFSIREAEVFSLLIRGFTLAHIAEVLFATPNSISKCSSAIKRRLGIRNESELILYALQQKVIESPDYLL